MDTNNNPAPNTEPNVPSDSGLDMTPEQPEMAAGQFAESGTSPNTEPTTPPVIDPVMTNPTPVNPVIQPGSETAAPINPVFQPTGQDEISATDPIMQPERPTPPDPIQEELNAPMKAADPAPGSIGSAISGPAESNAGGGAPAENPFINSDPGQVPNVSFSDPAAMQAVAGSDKKANKNKNILMILIAVAAVVVVALVVILIIQLNSGNNNQSNSSTNTATVIDDNDEEEPDEVDTLDNGILSCTRNMTEEELAKYTGAVSGTISIDARFIDSTLDKISLVESVVNANEDSTNSEPVEVDTHAAIADELDTTTGAVYNLPLSGENQIDLNFEAVLTNYQNLDFTCEVL